MNRSMKNMSSEVNNIQCGDMAPVALFIYKRANHTKELIESLRRCDGFNDTKVYVYADGPRSEHDVRDVMNTREVARAMLGNHAHYIERNENMGLANSIIHGVSKICREYGRVIVLEDDLVVSNKFIEYMNSALYKYRNEEKIMQISGYMYPIDEFICKHEALFLPVTTSWGWATWERSWKLFDKDMHGSEILDNNRNIRIKFNLDGAYDYYGMLKKQKNGVTDSWAIRWYWSVFNNKGLILYPPISMVKNIGFDGSGTHGWRSARRVFYLENEFEGKDIALPEHVYVKNSDYSAIKKMLITMRKSPISWLKDKIGKISHYIG